jgi:ubiquitin C-terminal hydrolase
MINYFLGEEIIEDLNCEQCKMKRNFKKESVLYSLPNFLILHISRFIKGYYESQKNSRQIIFDQILSFDEQCSKRKVQYRLLGVIHHIGTLDRGHYYADARINNEWF